MWQYSDDRYFRREKKWREEKKEDNDVILKILQDIFILKTSSPDKRVKCISCQHGRKIKWCTLVPLCGNFYLLMTQPIMDKLNLSQKKLGFSNRRNANEPTSLGMEKAEGSKAAAWRAMGTFKLKWVSVKFSNYYAEPVWIREKQTDGPEQ